jgi:hypothetical protein
MREQARAGSCASRREQGRRGEICREFVMVAEGISRGFHMDFKAIWSRILLIPARGRLAPAQPARVLPAPDQLGWEGTCGQWHGEDSLAH